MHIARKAASMLLIAAIAACHDSPADPIRPPVIANVAARLNELNALSAYVDFVPTGADSARIVFRPATGGALDSTPFVAVTVERPRIAALGLFPDTEYVAVVDAVHRGVHAVSDTVRFRTQPLPEQLEKMTIAITGAAPTGFILLNPLGSSSDSTAYAVAFDGTGRLRWYRGFPGGPNSVEVKQQHNGNFTAGVGTVPKPGYHSRFYEFTPAGQIVREYAASAPNYLDLHELLLTSSRHPNPVAHHFEFEMRDTAGVPLAAGRLVRRTADGTTLWSWSAWDHFTPEDAIEPNSAGDLSFDHPNSIGFDHDGGYIVSWRNFGEVTAIDYETGAIKWRLGGRHNEFTFIGDPLNGFSAQHSARMLSNGNLLLYDNGSRHDPSETRAVEYHLDLTAKTATMVWQYRHSPVIYTAWVGSVQRYTSGNTLIGYGLAGRIVEATPSRTAAWEGTVMGNGQPMGFYRALKVPSLYRYERP